MTSWLGQIFRYGKSVWLAGGLTKDGTSLRDRFANPPLTTDLMQLMISLGILDPAQELAPNGLNNRGIEGAYITEVLGPQVERSSFQGVPSTSTLAAMLALAQEDNANFYIGGELIDRLEQVISATDATVHVGATVEGIKNAMIDEDKSAWLVSYGAMGVSGIQAEAFDKIIVAAPDFNLYQVSSMDDIEAASVITYQPVYITFFTTASRFRSDLFNDINQILFFDNQDENSNFYGVKELAFVREVSRTNEDGNRVVEYLYRALSNGGAEEQLRRLDQEITWLYQTKVSDTTLIYPNSLQWIIVLTPSTISLKKRTQTYTHSDDSRRSSYPAKAFGGRRLSTPSRVPLT